MPRPDSSRQHQSHRHRHRAGSVMAALAIVAAGTTAGAPEASAEAPTGRTCATSGARTYTVERGQSWFVVAREVGVRMTSLLEANGASTRSSMFPGDVLCLPAGASPSAGSVTASSTGCATPYTAASGDSWFSIAKAAGISMTSLLKTNSATTSTTLRIGAVVCLPAGSTSISSSARSTSTATAGALDALPVQGPCWYGDTWSAARANGRRHQGVDLITTEGNYVYAVTDGTLTNRAWDQPGLLAGNAWWLTAADGSGTYYFYGHLTAFAPGLQVGSRVEAGEIIGFVGETGSAATPHLHFEIHPNGGGAVNPYPVVRSQGGCKTGDGYQQPDGWIPVE